MRRPGLGFRVLVGTTALAAWALVAVGGLVRVSESGLGCPDWPLCDGRVVPTGQKEPIIEYSHRFTAATVIVLLLLSAIWAYRRHGDRRDITASLTAALGLALALLVLALRHRGPLLAGIAPALFASLQIPFGIGIVLTGHGTAIHDTFRKLHVAGSGAVRGSLVAVFAVVTTPATTSEVAPSPEVAPVTSAHVLPAR